MTDTRGTWMTRWWRSPQLVFVLAFLIVAILFVAKMAIASIYLNQNTAQAVARAASLTPADEEVLLRLADLDATRRAAYLQEAAKNNPRDPQPLLELGLMAEMNNDPRRAEYLFQQAQGVDVRAETSWMLANFYFRQKNLAAFQLWGKRYRAFAAGSVAGLFRMEWSRTHSVAQLLMNFSPLTCDELTSLAAFLDTRVAAIDAFPIDEKLASCSGAGARSALMTEVSRLLESDQANAALLLWNRLSQASDFPYAPLNPAAGVILTNADFSGDLNERGFNWRINRTPGVAVRRVSHTLQLTFDGQEPQGSILLFEPVVLKDGTTYELSYRLHSEDTDGAGFRWRMVELSTGKTLDGGAGNELVRHGDSVSWRFEAPHSLKTIVLALEYVRPSGQIKEQGRLVLSEIKLRAMAG